ncbi:hypothetical protein CHS0354_028306 [Potamilus streckersoni]|uniref:PHD-type domain-containing protein n=1 Tax=Potamilus streckersoni TaxID=2493646 RepID=A0AAE0RTS8_9BIVA|nr:hypothetical protein CHS0354_028306 [Potamilus streckersoni]
MDQENVCGFCKRGTEAEDICGRLHSEFVKGKRITAHHKCMQYSALLVQYKFEHFGGFKISRVQEELKRGGKVHCSICRGKKSTYMSGGATAGCAVSRCKKSFHFYCAEINPQTITKRLKVKDKKKEIVLYRVFCSKEHEDYYRTQLRDEMTSHLDQSDDSESSDTNDEDGDDESDTFNEGEQDLDVSIKSMDYDRFLKTYSNNDQGRTHNKTPAAKNSKDDKEDSSNSGQFGATGSVNGFVPSDITEDFNTSPDAVSDSESNSSDIACVSGSMPNSEFVSQHQNSIESLETPQEDQIMSYRNMPPKIINTAKNAEETLEEVQIVLQDPLLKKGKKTQGKEVMDKMNKVQEPDIRQESFGHNPDSAKKDKFLVVIVPDVVCSSDLRQKIHRWAHSEFNMASSEYVIVWQDIFCPVGLREQHLSHIMYDVCDKILKCDTDGLSQILFNCDLDKYSHTIQLTDMIKGQDLNVIDSTIFGFINEILKDTNSKSKSKLLSLLSLPSSSALGMLMDDCIDPTYQVRSRLHKPLYQWTSETKIVAGTGNIRYRPNPEFERSTVMMELQKLLCGRFELQTRPVEDVFCIRMADSFMDKMKQKLQELFAVPIKEGRTLQPSKKQIVLCITGVNRELVKYKAYVRKVTEEFLSKYINKGMELFCIFSIGESNEFASYQDVVPVKFHAEKNLTVFSAFCPEFVPVECVVLRCNNLEVAEKESVLTRLREPFEPNIKRNLNPLFTLSKPDVEMPEQSVPQNLHKEQETDRRNKILHISLRRGRSTERPDDKTSEKSPRLHYAKDNEKPSTSGWTSPRKKKRALERLSYTCKE